MDQGVSFSSLPNANYSLAGLRKYIRHCAQIHFLMGSNRRVGLIGRREKEGKTGREDNFFWPESMLPREESFKKYAKRPFNR